MLMYNIKQKVLIGIDPGNTTGIAYYYKTEKRLECFQYKSHIEAILSTVERLKELTAYDIYFRIEDARKQKKRPDLKQMNRGKEQGVGSVKARSKDWEDLCIKQGWSYEMCEPKRTPYKENPALFEKLTGIKTLKGESHLRDSAVLVYGF